MPFTKREKQLLLAASFVGPKVIERLEAIGIDNFNTLAAANAENVVHSVADMLKTSCWKNSSQAKKAIENAIEVAKTNIAVPRI